MFPLPAHAGGQWGKGAAAAFLGGLLLIGAGFLVLFLDVARAVVARYGGLGRGLGWPALFGTAEPPPPAVVASTSVAIVNVVSLTTGATVLVLNLLNLAWPAFRVDPLLAKNMTYFFGHVFINTTMYMSIIAVYEILPRYAGRPWKVGKPVLAAWTATTLMVLAVYPHHLFMDFVMPRWALVMGQVLSYASGIPVLAVTTLGTLALVHRSGLKWDLVAALLFLSVFGWVAGVIPAIVDATIVVNQVMHNTLWVPGHFHFYLILGVVAMNAAFALDLVRVPGAAASAADRAIFWLFAVGGAGFATMFLVAGWRSIPRRYAEHLPEWMAYDRIGSLFGALVLAAMVAFLWRFLARVRSAATA